MTQLQKLIDFLTEANIAFKFEGDSECKHLSITPEFSEEDKEVVFSFVTGTEDFESVWVDDVSNYGEEDGEEDGEEKPESACVECPDRDTCPDAN